jgi:hypothetical protein
MNAGDPDGQPIMTPGPNVTETPDGAWRFELAPKGVAGHAHVVAAGAGMNASLRVSAQVEVTRKAKAAHRRAAFTLCDAMWGALVIAPVAVTPESPDDEPRNPAPRARFRGTPPSHPRVRWLFRC